MKLPPIPETPELTALLAKARDHVMMPDEIFEQRVSFVWGQLPAGSTRTKDQVRASLADFYGCSLSGRS